MYFVNILFVWIFLGQTDIAQLKQILWLIFYSCERRMAEEGVGIFIGMMHQYVQEQDK